MLTSLDLSIKQYHMQVKRDAGAVSGHLYRQLSSDPSSKFFHGLQGLSARTSHPLCLQEACEY